VFVDTNIFIAALNERDSDHEQGRVLLEAAFGRQKWLYTSDYVLDECFSVAWSKTSKQPKPFRLSLIRRLDDTIQESEKVRLLKVDARDFTNAKSFLRKNPAVIPTLTDWTSLVLMKRNRISRILSFDRHFDEARKIGEFHDVRRVDEVAGIVSNTSSSSVVSKH